MTDLAKAIKDTLIFVLIFVTMGVAIMVIGPMLLLAAVSWRGLQLLGWLWEQCERQLMCWTLTWYSGKSKFVRERWAVTSTVVGGS